MSGSAERCLNCDAELSGPFCAACGQKKVDVNKGLLQVVLDLLSETFEADGRLHRTAPSFFLRPGQHTAEWAAGRRARFTSPVRIFVFALFVGFVGLNIAAMRSASSAPDVLLAPEISDDGTVRIRSTDGGSNFQIHIDDTTDLAALGLPRTERAFARAVAGTMVDFGPTMIVLLVPVLAGLLKVVLWRELAVKHLVFSLNLHSRFLILAGLLLGIGGVWPAALLGLAMQIYLAAGIARAYQLSWKQAVWRYFAVALSYGSIAMLGFLTLAIGSAVATVLTPEVMSDLSEVDDGEQNPETVP